MFESAFFRFGSAEPIAVVLPLNGMLKIKLMGIMCCVATEQFVSVYVLLMPAMDGLADGHFNYSWNEVTCGFGTTDRDYSQQISLKIIYSKAKSDT